MGNESAVWNAEWVFDVEDRTRFDVMCGPRRIGIVPDGIRSKPHLNSGRVLPFHQFVIVSDFELVGPIEPTKCCLTAHRGSTVITVRRNEV